MPYNQMDACGMEIQCCNSRVGLGIRKVGLGIRNASDLKLFMCSMQKLPPYRLSCKDGIACWNNIMYTMQQTMHHPPSSDFRMGPSKCTLRDVGASRDNLTQPPPARSTTRHRSASLTPNHGLVAFCCLPATGRLAHISLDH